MKKMILRQGQYLQDTQLHIQEQRAIVIAPTGCGKTTWAIQEFTKFDMVFPTKLNGFQKAQQYHLHFVHQHVAVTSADKQLGTFDAITKFMQRDCSDRVLIIDESHQYILSASPDFRKETIDALLAAIPKYKQVILLTGTHIESHHSLLQTFEVYYIEQEHERDIPYTCISASDPLATLRQTIQHAEHDEKTDTETEIAANTDTLNHKLHVIFCNDKKRIQTYSAYFEQQNLHAGIVTSDTVSAHDPLSMQIITKGYIPNDYRVLLSTSVLTESVDIYNTNVASIHFLTQETPATIKQFIARFRTLSPTCHIYVYVPQITSEAPTFDRTVEEARLYTKAASKLAFFNNLLTEEMIDHEHIVNAIRAALQSEFTHMFTLRKRQYVIDELSIAYYVYAKFCQHIYQYTPILKQELQRYHLQCIATIISHTTRSQEDRETLIAIKNSVKEAEQQVFQQEISICQVADSHTLRVFAQKSRVAEHVVTLMDTYQIPQQRAVKFVSQCAMNTQRFNTLCRRLLIAMYKQKQLTDIEGTIDRLYTAFEVGQKYTVESLTTILTTIFAQSEFYHYNVTSRTAVRILKDFYTVKRCKITNAQNVNAINVNAINVNAINVNAINVNAINVNAINGYIIVNTMPIVE